MQRMKSEFTKIVDICDQEASQDKEQEGQDQDHMKISHTIGTRLWILVMCMISWDGSNLVQAQAVDAGTTFLNQKETDVKSIATAASNNANNCGLLTSCLSTCSRELCNPRVQDFDQSICTTVQINDFCPPPGVNNSLCSTLMMLDYSTSYMALSPGDLVNEGPEVRRDICLQRALDPTFQNVSNPANYSLVYYGSTSGMWRGFPGREWSDSQCGEYETRMRPWYLDGISVLKQVKVLIDTGLSMGTPVNGEFQRGEGTTYLNVAQNITLEMLKTTSPGDFVDVSSFNSSGSFPQGGKVHIGAYNSTNPAVHPELAPINAEVGNLSPSSDTVQSNLTTAILDAVSNFEPDTTSTSLKFIIIFTDGNFAPLNTSTFPAHQLLALRVKVILYKLPPNPDSDPYLNSTTLPQVLCSANGTFELLDAASTLNPLYSIRSFYTFLAHTHINVSDSKPTWSNVYVSFSQETNVITVTYPAFGSDGMLLGVAGIDVFLDELSPSIQSLVTTDLTYRRRGTLFAPQNLTFTCNYQLQSAPTDCPLDTVPGNGIICEQTDTRTLPERVCCGPCAYNPSISHHLSAWAIVGIVVGAIVFLIVCCIIGYWIWICCEGKRRIDAPRYQVPPPQANVH